MEINQIEQMDQLEMEDPTIQIILLINGILLISKIQEVMVDIGQPDCRLICPCQIDQKTKEINFWLEDYTKGEEFAISSDKILTIIDPKQSFIDKYLEFIK